jgi:hypothetical protein
VFNVAESSHFVDAGLKTGVLELIPKAASQHTPESGQGFDDLDVATCHLQCPFCVYDICEIYEL